MRRILPSCRQAPFASRALHTRSKQQPQHRGLATYATSPGGVLLPHAGVHAGVGSNHAAYPVTGSYEMERRLPFRMMSTPAAAPGVMEKMGETPVPFELPQAISHADSNDPLNLNKCSLMFTLEDSYGSLKKALDRFEKHGISMSRIESRPSKRSSDYEFYVDFPGSETDNNIAAFITEMREHCREVSVLHSYEVPWFPRRIKEVDRLATDTMDAGAELEADHPGFSDEVYRQRRRELAHDAEVFKMGQQINFVQYTQDEIQTWAQVYGKLKPLLLAHACEEHVRLLPHLEKRCGFRMDNIPQLQDVSEFLKECSGFQLRPVTGLLTARNFLYGLAFRIFFSTQYIRHHSKPLYTPEPDICHELMGHAPLFADKNFADFSQEIGLAALGASDEQILKLARVYWFSVEFGLCRQHGQRKAYGAGLLSSFGELEYSMSAEPTVLPWNPFDAGERDYPITTYQPVYYEATSFEDAKRQMKRFSDNFARPFNVRYNPYTQSIEVDRNVKIVGDTESPYV